MKEHPCSPFFGGVFFTLMIGGFLWMARVIGDGALCGRYQTCWEYFASHTLSEWLLYAFVSVFFGGLIWLDIESRKHHNKSDE
jgi:hypothetical protein